GFFLISLTALSAGEVVEPSVEHCRLKVDFDVEPTTAGSLQLRLHVSLDPMFHIYSSSGKGFGTPTRIEWGGTGYVPEGPLTEPEPHRLDDPMVGEPQFIHEGSVTFVQKIKVTDKARFVPVIRVIGQVCDDNGCYPLEAGFQYKGPGTSWIPFKGVFEDLKVETPPAVVPAVAPAIIESSTPAVVKSVPSNEGLWSAFLAGAVGGLLAMLTPCVFPMIPITLSYFLKQSGENRLYQLKLAGIYACGVVVFFTGLGVGLTLVLGHEGPNWMATNPWINLGIGIVFLLFALSFLGAFELRPPSFLMSAAAAGRKGGALGALMMGLTFAVTSFTCTFPVVGSQLALTAGNGELAAPIATMLGFSGLIAAVFFGLSLFPALASGLPKSGGWLGVVKVTLGFAELALSLKFFRVADIHWGWDILTHDLVLLTWSAIHLVAAVYLLGLVSIGHSGGPTIGVGRMMAGLGALVFSGYLAFGLMGADISSDIQGFLLSDPPGRGGFKVSAMSAPAAEQVEGEIFDDYDKGLARAKELKKPLFVDFSGRNCSNCRKMEVGVFPRSKDLLAHYVEVRLMTDEGTEPSKKWARLQFEKYKDISLPFYALETPEGVTLATTKGLISLEAFRSFLEKGLNR
ncbi:MAG: cytochrome c biogenesis protein CcdA, partial [Planctomycetota bacterium]